MKNKTPIILGGVFILLVIVFVLTTLNPREVGQGAESLFPAGSKPDIDRIELTSTARGEIILERVDGIWRITKPVDYLVDENLIYSMLDELETMQVDGVLAGDESRRSQFGAAEAGTTMKVYSGDELVVDVVVGKNAVDLAHTYVWDNEDGAVELWRGLFASFTNTDVDGWRDKTVYSFNPGDIIRVEVTDSAGTRVLNHPDTTWTYTENGVDRPVNDTNITQYLALIAGLRADGFADVEGIQRVAGNEPDTRVSFRVRTGDIHTFEVWSPEEGGTTYYMRKENGDIIFRLYQYRGSRLAMTYDQLSA